MPTTGKDGGAVRRAGRAAAFLAGAAFLAPAPSPAGGQEAVEIAFQGETKPQWELTPEWSSLTARRGEVLDAALRVSNRTDREVVAIVLTEIQPEDAINYLVHLGCGPTLTLVLRAGETVRVPGSYLVMEGTPRETTRVQLAYTVYSFDTLEADPRETGRRIYVMRCAACHGALGRGDGPVGRLLNPAVDDLTPALRSKGDGELLAAIRAGVGPMPGFSPVLSESEQRGLLRYLRSLPAGREAGAVR